MDFLAIALPIGLSLTMISVFMGLCSYSVLAERKVSSWIQGRVGPNRTRLPLLGNLPIIGNLMTGLGLFQPAADGLKFLFKDFIESSTSSIVSSLKCCNNLSTDFTALIGRSNILLIFYYFQ